MPNFNSFFHDDGLAIHHVAVFGETKIELLKAKFRVPTRNEALGVKAFFISPHNVGAVEIDTGIKEN